MSAITTIRKLKAESILPDFRIVIVNDEQTRKDLGELRYASYLDDHTIDPNPTGLYLDSYDQMNNSWSILAYSGDRPIGSLRLSFMQNGEDPSRVPVGAVFRAEIQKYLDGDNPNSQTIHNAMEINRICRHPDFKQDGSVIYRLFQITDAIIANSDTEVIFGCFTKVHTRFYRNFGFETIAGPKHYKTMKMPEMYLVGVMRLSFVKMSQSSHEQTNGEFVDQAIKEWSKRVSFSYNPHGYYTDAYPSSEH